MLLEQVDDLSGQLRFVLQLPGDAGGEWPVTLTDLGANFNITAKVAGNSFSISYLGTGAATATLTTPQPNVGAEATGTGNL